MLSNIIYNQDLSSDFQTDWVTFSSPSIEARKRISDNTLIINWTDVQSDQPIGLITILGAGESQLPAIGSTIHINTADNSDDCWNIKLSNYVNYLKIKYNKNNT